ncbi:hypothetical protein BOX15_Mlig021710g1, partial [Macrostomum lignano]
LIIMSLLETYEQQFGITIAEITSKINQISRISDPDERQSAESQAERLFAEARETLEQLELETRSQPPSIRQKYSTRLQSYTAEQKKLENDFKQAKDFAQRQQQRDELFSSGADDNNYHAASEYRARLLDNTERLERTGRRMEEGLGSVYETERVGRDILADLASQRETLTRSRDKLKSTNQDLGSSSRILGGMMRRVVQNRALLLLILGVMLLVIGAVLYVALKPRTLHIGADSATSTTPTKLPVAPAPVP